MAIITTLQNETTLHQLTRRLYGSLDVEGRERAEKALLRANPHLAERASFRPGTVLEVPAVMGLKLQPAVGGPEPAEELRQALAASAAEYRERLARHLDEHAGSLEAQGKLLKDRHAAAAIKQAGGTQIADELAEAVRERTRAIPEERRRREVLFDRLSADLKALHRG